MTSKACKTLYNLGVLCVKPLSSGKLRKHHFLFFNVKLKNVNLCGNLIHFLFILLKLDPAATQGDERTTMIPDIKSVDV